jgi:hypothetical protein
VKEYRLRQKEHYVTHSDEEDHAALWQDIREHGNAIVREGELSAKSLAALIEEAREQFAKGVSINSDHMVVHLSVRGVGFHLESP